MLSDGELPLDKYPTTLLSVSNKNKLAQYNICNHEEKACLSLSDGNKINKNTSKSQEVTLFLTKLRRLDWSISVQV